MIPLRDANPTKIFPLLTVLIILVNVFVFLQELLSADLDRFIATWALIPKFIDFNDYSTLIPFVTSQFLHAGWFHILSNMWFLWIFGDNVEEHFGRFFFPILYLGSGIVGGFFQYILNPGSPIPMLGASGAVAGILGAYMVLFSRHKISTLIPVFGFFTVVDVPAGVMLFYWFLTQIFSGLGSLALATSGGVAFFAHIGGFITGLVLGNLVHLGHKKEHYA